MLVHVENIADAPGNLRTARVRTVCGRATVRWCGDPAAGPGAYHVEWTVDEDVIWRRNAEPAPAPGPAIRTAGPYVVLRGRLHRAEDGSGHLELAGSVVLLDLVGDLPADVIDTWVELRLGRAGISVHPYHL
ncbi:hypothetical protein [Kitasatospora sp. NPDC088346]|uniref:hypothetical protein n=1 Tax=Kitasatospora sp. NPDC088346 TaxID=3364073 RepID=UPI0038278D36